MRHLQGHPQSLPQPPPRTGWVPSIGVGLLPILIRVGAFVLFCPHNRTCEDHLSIPAGRPMLKAHSIACVRGDRLLFQGLSLEVGAGEVCQVQGHNGVGKTTLLRVLCGLSLPESGGVFWNGTPIHEDSGKFQSDLTYIGHSNGVKLDLTPRENLAFALTLHSSTPDASIDDALERVDLSASQHLLCRVLSAGQRRRVAIARLYLSRAPLWVLDEPLGAIDAAGVQGIENAIEAHLDQGGIAILTTHQPLRLQRAAIRAVHLDN
jgi:heme exporter protein A